MMFCHFDSLGLHYKISATDRGTNRMVISWCNASRYYALSLLIVWSCFVMQVLPKIRTRSWLWVMVSGMWPVGHSHNARSILHRLRCRPVLINLYAKLLRNNGRPVSLSSGRARPYFLFSFHPLISWPIVNKLCHMLDGDRYLHNWIRNMCASPLEIRRPKNCKMSEDFIQLRDLIANISGSSLERKI